MNRVTKVLQDREALVLGLVVIVLVAFGGGGSPSPLSELITQLGIALCAVAFAIVRSTADAARPAIQRVGPWVVAGLALALPILHLIPLPASVWQGLPGREPVVAALELIGRPDAAIPLSIAPARTVASLLAMAAALAVMLMAAHSTVDRRAFYIPITLMALVSVVVGAGQLAGGDLGALRFYGGQVNALLGFQANRNAEADILLIGMLAAAAVIAPRRSEDGRYRWSLLLGFLAVTVVLMMGVVLTKSRAGIMILPLALVFQLAILRPRLAQWPKGATGIALGLGGAAVAALAAVLAVTNPVLRGVAKRFSFGNDFRPELWTDTRYAIDTFWPIGSGIGTFTPAFLAAERLEVVDPSYPNRAHNDYLEFTLEAGVLGWVLFAAVTILIVYALFTKLRTGMAGERATALFASGTLAVIAAHSLVDYPLRSMSLAGLGGIAVGLAFSRVRISGPGREVIA